MRRRHCERSEAIQGQVFDAAMDRHGGKSRLAMTAECILPVFALNNDLAREKAPGLVCHRRLEKTAGRGCLHKAACNQKNDIGG